MTAYITDVDYLEFTGGNDDIPDNFVALANLASDQTDILTSYQIRRKGLESFSPTQQELIRKAVCAQVHYLEAYGGMDALTDNFSSMTLGKFSYSDTGNGNPRFPSYSPISQSYLSHTGLLYSGIDWR